MNEEFYSFDSPRIEFRYDFISISNERKVQKVVRFRLTNLEDLYSLSLLDVLPDGTTSDSTETNNRDMNTVLATVMRIAIDFLDKYPYYSIAIQGSDAKRQRLYQIIVSRELDFIQQQFNVLGGNGSQVEPFRKDSAYEFFIFSKRN